MSPDYSKIIGSQEKQVALYSKSDGTAKKKILSCNSVKNLTFFKKKVAALCQKV
jgi:hypothetical protein